MAKGHPRSAKTGRYVTKATAARHCRTTVVERGGNKWSGKAYRSAISGKLARRQLRVRGGVLGYRRRLRVAAELAVVDGPVDQNDQLGPARQLTWLCRRELCAVLRRLQPGEAQRVHRRGDAVAWAGGAGGSVGARELRRGRRGGGGPGGGLPGTVAARCGRAGFLVSDWVCSAVASTCARAADAVLVIRAATYRVLPT